MRALLTSRAARWVTIQVGRHGRPVDEVATELGCGWHTVNNEVGRWGEALLDADTDRVGEGSTRMATTLRGKPVTFAVTLNHADALLSDYGRLFTSHNPGVRGTSRVKHPPQATNTVGNWD